jgi:intracellular septation protein A
MFFEMTKGNLCTLNVVATTFLLLASQILNEPLKVIAKKLNKNCAICLIVALCVCSGGRTILIDCITIYGFFETRPNVIQLHFASWLRLQLKIS